VTDMIERVARAILSGHNWAAGDLAPNGFDEMTAHWQEAYRAMARAAIEAMREPTPEMVADGVKAAWREPNPPQIVEDQVRKIHRAMIAAALSTSKRGEP